MSDTDFESKHPRIPAGQPGGGQFTNLEGSAGGDPLQVATASFSEAETKKNAKGIYKQPSVAALQGIGGNPKDAAKYEAQMQATLALFHNTDVYPNFTEKELSGTPAQQAKAIVDHMASNDKFLYEHAGEAWLKDKSSPNYNPKQNILEDSKVWYGGAHARGEAIAERDGFHPASVMGMIAKLSPQKDWDMNVEMADRLSHIYRNQQDTKWSPEMEKTAKDTVAKQLAASVKAYTQATGAPPTKERYADMVAKKEGVLAAARDHTLANCPSVLAQAAWIRTYDETYHSSAFSSFNPDGSRGANVKTAAGVDQKLVWNTNGFIADGIKMLNANGHPDKISEILGDGHKVRSFYNNILDPTSPNHDVTGDTHQVGANLFRSGKAIAVAVGQNLNTMDAKAKEMPGGNVTIPSSKVTGINGTYPFHADAVRQAAKEEGVIPNAMQAVSWVVKRASFSRASDEALAKVEKTWHEYHDANGRISQRETQEKVWNIIKEDVTSRSGKAAPDSEITHENDAMEARTRGGVDHYVKAGTPDYLGPKGDNPEDFL